MRKKGFLIIVAAAHQEVGVRLGFSHDLVLAEDILRPASISSIQEQMVDFPGFLSLLPLELLQPLG